MRTYLSLRASCSMNCSMPASAAVMLLIVLWFISPPGKATAQSSPFQQSDGTAGMISPLGQGEAIYSDPHGNKHPSHFGSGLPSHSFSAPHGATPGTITPFGTPAPPNLLTPAPLLPLHPKGMATPQPQAPALPVIPSPFGPSGGRPGR